MRWEIVADALCRDAERLRADAARALGTPRVTGGSRRFAYGGPVNALPPDLLAQRQREIREADQRNRRATPICGAMTCRCGKGKHGDCAYWRARDAREGPADTWTEPEMIAQQLWRESRELLAKVGVELPTSPPPPVKPMRWYRHPLVKRFGWFGIAPALTFLLGFYGLTGQLLFGGPIVVFLWGAFINYEMTVRTDARGVEVRSRLKPRHFAARIVAITVISIFIGWVT